MNKQLAIRDEKGRYTNPWDDWVQPTTWRALKWKLQFSDKSNVPSDEILDITLPVFRPDINKLHNPPVNRIQSTWIGHATVLVQFDGLNILTDPVWCDRCSPSSLVGPKRYRPVPLELDELPRIDIVIISHNHYDHMDIQTIRDIELLFSPTWYVPMGNKWLLESNGVSKCYEMTWWQKITAGYTVTCLPCQHWSRRWLFDTNRTLWASWLITGPSGRKFYFAGDTGYSPVFKQIGHHYGPIDFAAIPIGAYSPRWLTTPQHVDPGQAVKLHQDIRAKYSLAIHWGTFTQSDEFYLEPPKLLFREMAKKEIREIFVLPHGGMILA